MNFPTNFSAKFMEKMASRSPSETAGDSTNTGLPAGRRLANVLYVEDSIDDIALNYHLLKAEGIRFHEFVTRDGEELINFLEQRPPFLNVPKPDLVLLDLNMPRLDGRAALIYMQTHIATKNIPLVVLSGSNVEEDRQLSLERGAVLYLVKPFNLAFVQEIVAAVPSLCLDVYEDRQDLCVC